MQRRLSVPGAPSATCSKGFTPLTEEIEMNTRQKAAAVAGGFAALAIGGLGVSAAFAQAPTAPADVPAAIPAAGPAVAPAAARLAVPAAVVAAQTPAPPPTETSETTGAEAPGSEAPEGPEGPEAAEPGDANLPGGGHADPEGQNVDHQFEGTE